MIGDVFKFIEYVQSIKVPPVAKALFYYIFQVTKLNSKSFVIKLIKLIKCKKRI